MKPGPVVVGVTGGIGAGKSTVVDAFVERGAVAFSADEAVHRLYRDDADVRAAIVTRWGEDVVAPDGSIDRARIADIVFAQPAELEWLEGVLHPLVAREWMRFVAAHAEAPLVVAEVPLLFEADLDGRYDATVLVTAPLEARLERVGQRATGASHAAARAELQLDDEAKRRRATYVIDNTGAREDVGRQVDQLIDSLREEQAT